MPLYCLSFFILIIFPICSYYVLSCDSCSWGIHQYVQQLDKKFEQRSQTFWEFEDQSKTWIQVKLPYDLVSCINDDCTKVGSIINKKETTQENPKQQSNESHEEVLVRLKKKIGSLRRMSETSIWVTGQSGSIYERFWNGLQWVVAPHDLPITAGPAVSVFMVNNTVLALSQAGNLYQMRLAEDSQPEWIHLKPVLNPSIHEQTERSSEIKLTSGVISYDLEKIYFCTKHASLLELNETDPVRWINHGRPPGGDVAVIADAEMFKPNVIFTISSMGHLYEYDKSAKPPWKKHLQREELKESTSLAPTAGCILHGVGGAHWVSLFLLTKGGALVERRLHQRKWKWLVHENPENYPLTSITCTTQHELTENSNFLFLTTASGDIYEYRISKQTGMHKGREILETWENHRHPPYAKVAIGIPGIQLHVGRMMFPLDDGRVAELHMQGIGGETSPINQKFTTRRKTGFKLVWSILDAPESEGWNAEYCSGERGPVNCITGTTDEHVELEDTRSSSTSKRRRVGVNAEQNYLPIISISESHSSKSPEDTLPFPDNNLINRNFRLRQVHGGNSVFLVSDDGMLYEFLSNDNLQFWLRNDEQLTAVKGIVGSYNGSLFVVDEHDSLLLIKDRRTNEEVAWINCTAMKKGRKVIAGPSWNGVSTTATLEDAIYFVSTTGKLLQFRVALGNFKWKNCKNPQNVRIACIVDQEEFRRNIVFVIGRNGRIYQYNKITELWHEHYQSKHLSLSRSPGTTMRPSTSLKKGSIFMISVDGGLVEYKFNYADGWQWIEHGTPSTSVILKGSLGPCFGNSELFAIGSDGRVYLRYFDDQAIWRWKDMAFPLTEDSVKNGINQESGTLTEAERLQHHQQHRIDEDCDTRVQSTRPIPFTEDSVIFQLRDGRLAEMQKKGEGNWEWKRTIGTPTSKCMEFLWATLVSQDKALTYYQLPSVNITALKDQGM